MVLTLWGAYIKLKSPEIMYAIDSKQINDQSLHMYSKNFVSKIILLLLCRGFPDNSVKNPPAMQETPVQILGWKRSSGYPLQYS